MLRLTRFFVSIATICLPDQAAHARFFQTNNAGRYIHNSASDILLPF